MPSLNELPPSGQGLSGPENSALLRFWGVRGSIPSPGPATVHYGGNTSCLEIRADGQLIILDAGTGVRGLGQALATEAADSPLHVTVLLTHMHWDHIQGLPFFQPLFRPQDTIRILGFQGSDHSLETVLFRQMDGPVFPIGLRDAPASVRIEELDDFDFHLGPVRVRAMQANHPGQCVGYRLDTSRGSLAFFPDNEPYAGRIHSAVPGKTRSDLEQELIAFVHGVDVLVMDAQYEASEYPEHVGWGHGWTDAVVKLALEAGVGRLFLFHHDPDHGDAKVSSMAEHARELARAAGSNLFIEAAREGDEIFLRR